MRAANRMHQQKLDACEVAGGGEYGAPLFATKTYNQLQQTKGHENDCGRPGVNGGYIANKEVKFGINCYGNKPKITEQEEELMKTATPYPESEKDIAFQKRVDFWKNKVDQILVSPFNYDTWGSF